MCVCVCLSFIVYRSIQKVKITIKAKLMIRTIGARMEHINSDAVSAGEKKSEGERERERRREVEEAD